MTVTSPAVDESEQLLTSGRLQAALGTHAPNIHAAERLQQMAITGGGSAAEERREAHSSNRGLKN